MQLERSYLMNSRKVIMKKPNINFKQLKSLSKKGGASIFVVMFSIIILSIIVLGFTRLILSESRKTTNTDLSQSAYDSALAGIEDAKIALLKYHDCLAKGYTSKSGGNTCEQIIYNMEQGIKNQDCSTIQKVLGREQEKDNNSVVVQETQTSTEAGNNKNMLQAYTCVTIKEDLEDYRTTLTHTSRLRVIPIRSEMIDNIGYLQIKWFSSVNHAKLQSSGSGIKYCNDKLYPNGSCNGSYQAPPVLSARLIQTDPDFNLSELSVSRRSDWTNIGNLLFIPKNETGDPTIVSADKWGESANKAENQPLEVKCSTGDWYCRADIALPKTFNGSEKRNHSNTYLLVSLPYGAPDTDVSISAYNRDGIETKNRYDFTGVQARIDSTGRANDLYRRVETRVELVDTYFAYPEFEINMTGGSNNQLNKTFYVTRNCWTSNNGSKSTCPDSKEDSKYSEV